MPLSSSVLNKTPTTGFEPMKDYLQYPPDSSRDLSSESDDSEHESDSASHNGKRRLGGASVLNHGPLLSAAKLRAEALAKRSPASPETEESGSQESVNWLPQPALSGTSLTTQTGISLFDTDEFGAGEGSGGRQRGAERTERQPVGNNAQVLYPPPKQIGGGGASECVMSSGGDTRRPGTVEREVVEGQRARGSTEGEDGTTLKTVKTVDGDLQGNHDVNGLGERELFYASLRHAQVLSFYA
jgi:hypothetical protein